MQFLLPLIFALYLALPILVIYLILRANQPGKFWMTELFDELHDENITWRGRIKHRGTQRIEGTICTRADTVQYRSDFSGGVLQEVIKFKSRSVSFLYEDENLVAIRFDGGGEVSIGPKEKIAGKHLLGIVNREVQLAEPLVFEG